VDNKSTPSVFERGVNLAFVRSLEAKYGPFKSPYRETPDGRFVAKRLSEFTANEQYLILSRGSYLRFSKYFLRKLKYLLQLGKLNTVKQWFYTADGIVLPYYLSCEDPTTEVVDSLAKFALESCANNYSHFLKDMKVLKKAIRKAFALNTHAASSRSTRTYSKVLYSLKLGESKSNPAGFGRFVLLWTQTRASGLADGDMIRASLKKLEEVVCIPPPIEPITLDSRVLLDTVRGFWKVSGRAAKISVGTTSCVEYTRELGGKSSMLRYITSHKVLRNTYDPITLERVEVPARSCRNSHDVVSWAIQFYLENPVFCRIRRTHAVAEPSKARTIGVSPYAVSVLLGVCAHLVAPTLVSRSVRSGMKSSRHLWNFLRDTLNPQENSWQALGREFDDLTIFALSTDEETATDYGDLHVSNQIWSMLLDIGSRIEGFPVGLFALCKHLYRQPRIYLFSRGKGRYRPVVSSRGWPMGDLFTKVILTIVNDYACRLAGAQVYSLVGDDLIVLSQVKAILDNVLQCLEAVGMKISEEDTFISSRFAFYCEEGCLVPQKVAHTPSVQLRAGRELFYLDYPRIRLMIPTQSETDSYSSSNAGRFALLGKEARWVNRNNPKALELFARALLVQHLLVPQDSDVLCPFTPVEIGGDGSFPHSGEFLRRVVQSKARNVGEVKYRMSSLLTNRFGHKFVRSDKFDGVVHKHHLILPKIEGLKGLLPPTAIVEPDGDARKQLMNSVSIPFLERPSITFLRLCRELYYRDIFLGRRPREPVFDLDRRFGPYGTTPILSMERFRSTWLDPGFIYNDFEPYFVNKDEIIPYATTGLGWNFRGVPNTADSRWADWVRLNPGFLDRTVEHLEDYLSGEPLHSEVVYRLTNYFESDVYVMSVLDESYDSYMIMTRDIKLCLRIHNFVNATLIDQGLDGKMIYAIDPIIYACGRMEEVYTCVSPPGRTQEIVDQGAMIHCDFTEFLDGVPTTMSIEQLFMGTFTQRDSRFNSWIRQIELPRVH